MAQATSGGAVGAEERRATPSPSSRKPRSERAAVGGEGAKAHPRYRDRHEDYILVTQDDLREIKTLGWVQQALYGTGTFFFSGAFWLIMELMAHQEKFEFTPWMGVCIISMASGVVLAVVGLIMFSMRQKRLSKYFIPEATQ
jgi:hypothetical protein